VVQEHKVPRLRFAALGMTDLFREFVGQTTLATASFHEPSRTTIQGSADSVSQERATRSLDYAELPKERQFRFARNDRGGKMLTTENQTCER